MQSFKSLSIVRDEAGHFFNDCQSVAGLFGTSTAAIWIFGEFKDQIKFFVDEDEKRVGNLIEGIPILSLSQVPAGAQIFLPPISPDDSALHTRLRALNIDFRTVDQVILWAQNN